MHNEMQSQSVSDCRLALNSIRDANQGDGSCECVQFSSMQIKRLSLSSQNIDSSANWSERTH